MISSCLLLLFSTDDRNVVKMTGSQSFLYSVKDAINRLVYEPCMLSNDSPNDLLRKQLVITLSWAIFLVLTTTWKNTEKSELEKVAYIVGITVNVVSYLWLRVTKSCSDRFVALLTLSGIIPTILFDLVRAASRQSRSWPLFVLIMDFQLVCRTWRNTTIVTLFICILWLLVCGVESVLRFGLFDLSVLPSQSSRVESCSCEDLPCSEGMETQFSLLGVHLLVFLMDFVCTSSFCDKLYREKERVEASVQAANEVANHLALFDLPKAEASLIAARQKVPENMAVALEVLLKNLKEYRPFLPEALFSALHHNSEDSNSFSLSAPGRSLNNEEETEEVEVAILFTDIVGSTMSWETYPSAMRLALKLHNDIMRQEAIACFGYEVKTIGDAFMYSFDSPVEASRFAISVQDIFSRTVWPEPIQELNNKQGILIRIGLSFGTCVRETNPTTKRSDYVGQMVNRAARIEGRCLPGCIAIDSETESLVQPHLQELNAMLSTLGAPQVVKGIQDPIQLYSLVPLSLQYRLDSSIHLTSLPEVQTIALDTFITESSNMSLISIDRKKVFNKEVPATVCTILMGSSATSDPSATLLERIERVSRALDRSGGVFLSVSGAVLTLGFNISKPCKAHSESAFRFVELLRSSFADKQTNTCDAYLGISSGICIPTLVVNTSEQRFITALGAPFSLSYLLSVTASELKYFALYSHESDEVPKAVCIRPVALWSDELCGQLTVYEMCPFVYSNLISGEVQCVDEDLYSKSFPSDVKQVVLFGHISRLSMSTRSTWNLPETLTTSLIDDTRVLPM